MTAEPFCPVCGTVCGDDCPGPVVLHQGVDAGVIFLRGLATHAKSQMLREAAEEVLAERVRTTAPEGAETDPKETK